MQLPTVEQKNFFAAADTQYRSDLAVDTTAQAYLASRGFTAVTASTFGLGVVRHPLLGHERYRGRLAIPYRTPAGVVTFSFRCIAGHVCKDTVVWVDEKGKDHTCRKYMAPEGMERTLYNVLDFKKDSPRIYLVEGEIDAMTWSICGFPTIGIPGVKNFQDHHARCFTDYAEIFAITDGDSAGYELGSFLAREVRARVVRLPKGEDGNSLYVKGGQYALEQALADTRLG